MYRRSEKPVKQQYVLHMCSQYGELRPTNGSEYMRSVDQFGAPQQISTGFASWLRCCTDVVQWRSSKLCTVLGSLLGRYTTHCGP